MPLHVYKMQPALAVAFGATYRPGEWLLYLRGRSQAMSVSLEMDLEQAHDLKDCLFAAVQSFSTDHFAPSVISSSPFTGPLLSAPFDLEAKASQLRVLRHPHKRLLAIEIKGTIEKSPYLVEIWATPEQLAALAYQIGEATMQVQSRCPACGAVIEGDRCLSCGAGILEL